MIVQVDVVAVIWCVSAPLYSHLDWGGYLATARELAARGHQVIWVSEPSIAGAIDPMRDGLTFAPIQPSGWLWPPPPLPDVRAMPPQEAVMLRYRRALDTWLSEDLVAGAVEALIALAEQKGAPDLILTDPFLTASALAAEAIGAPMVVCGWPAMREIDDAGLFPVQRILADDSRARVDRLLQRFGLRGENIGGGAAPSVMSPHLHISYFSPTWFQGDVDNLLSQTRLVGGAPDALTEVPPAWLTDIPPDQPIALITLGTTFAGELGFFSWAAHAAARAGMVPIVTLGTHPIDPAEKARLKAALPKTTRLLTFAPFAHVMPRAQVIVHHGGMGTTHWAARCGVPQVIVPHAADQRGQAQRAAQAKVGVQLMAIDVQRGRLLEAVRAVAFDERVRANARALADEFASLGGALTAATLIEKTI